MRILITNDDGYRSEGLKVLADAFRALGDVTIVGPVVAASAAAAIADAMLKRPLPSRTFLNINVPRGQPKGCRVTVLAKRNHVTSVAERHDPKGRPYYWIEEGQNEWEPHDRSDYQAVRDGFVSITPLHPDLTAHDALAAVESLPIEKEAGVR